LHHSSSNAPRPAWTRGVWEERRVREQPQRDSGREAVTRVARGDRGGRELGRRRGLAVAREGDVRHAPQRRLDAVERRLAPEVAARALEQAGELAL
jgi:hypothetical protein